MPRHGQSNVEIPTAPTSASQTSSAHPAAHVPPGVPLPAQNGQFHGILPNGQFPPQFQHAFAQFQAVNQALAAQLASIGANNGPPGVPPPVIQAQATFPQPIPTPQTQHPVQQQQHAQNQQQSAAAGTHHNFGATPHIANQPNPPHGPPNAHRSQPAIASTIPGSTVVRENIGPNGERWQVVVQSQQFNVNPVQVAQSHTNVPHSMHPTRENGSQGMHSMTPQNPPISSAYVQLQSTLAATETTLSLNHPVPESVFSQAEETLRNIPNLSEQSRADLNSRLQNLARRATQFRETLQNQLNHVAQERMTTQRDTHGAESSGVYVLSSPSGPQALLISPAGLFTAPWQFPTISTVLPQHNIQLQPHPLPVVNPIINPLVIGQQPFPANQVLPVQQANPQQVDVAQAAQAQAQLNAQAQAQQEQGANQARDLLRILLPLGGHLWLFIRLFGFVYFFTAGANLSRTILLGLVAVIVFIAQTGVFRPIVQAVWEPIRRHAEALVPLAGNERRNPGPPVNANNNAAGSAAANRAITPQEAAERLLQERERHDVTFLRHAFRRIERAVALFAASLIPGVGERHIRAREEAEAARQEAQAREREAQALREEEESRQRRQQSDNAAVSGQGENDAGKVEGNEGSAEVMGQTPNATTSGSPAPLIEV